MPGRSAADGHQAPGAVLAARAQADRRSLPHRRREAQAASAGSSATRSSTTTPGWPTPRSTATSRPRPSPPFVERALSFFAGHGISRQATANRQRLDLHPQPLPARTAHRARHPAPPDPAANPQAQRQDRALPTDPRARMGLRTALPQLTRPRGSAPDLAQPLQPTGTTARSATGHPSAAFGTTRGTTARRGSSGGSGTSCRRAALGVVPVVVRHPVAPLVRLRAAKRQQHEPLAAPVDQLTPHARRHPRRRPASQHVRRRRRRAAASARRSSTT